VWRVDFTARAAMTATFLSTLVLPLEFSIYVGVGLSLLLYLYTASNAVRVMELEPIGKHQFMERPAPAHLPSERPVVLTVYGNLFFGAIQALEQALPAPGDAHRPVVILRLRGEENLGSTGIRFLEHYAAQLKARGGKLMLVGVSPRVEQQLRRTGALEWLGEENFFRANAILFSGVQKALDAAWAWLEAGQEAHSPSRV
jgi:SulP family sulfate permease